MGVHLEVREEDLLEGDVFALNSGLKFLVELIDFVPLENFIAFEAILLDVPIIVALLHLRLLLE